MFLTSYWFWRCNHVWQGSLISVIFVNTSFVIAKMRINIALIYWYCAFWSLVSCGTPSCCTFGYHALNNGDPDCDALDYVNVLGYNAMVNLIKTQGLEGLVTPWFVKLKTSRIMSDDNRCVSVTWSYMHYDIPYPSSFCRWLLTLIFHVW